jgi:hypothetical protein
MNFWRNYRTSRRRRIRIRKSCRRKRRGLEDRICTTTKETTAADRHNDCQEDHLKDHQEDRRIVRLTVNGSIVTNQGRKHDTLLLRNSGPLDTAEVTTDPTNLDPGMILQTGSLGAKTEAG